MSIHIKMLLCGTNIGKNVSFLEKKSVQTIYFSKKFKDFPLNVEIAQKVF
jgi:hypothetical protein